MDGTAALWSPIPNFYDWRAMYRPAANKIDT